MVRIHRSVAVALAAVSTATCTADFNGLVVLDLGEIVPGTTTYQFFASFDDPSDQVLSVGSGGSGGQSVDFEFHNGNPLVQVTALPGSGLHDTPAVSPISGPGDSWVTIGGDWSNGMTDTEFSPGFLGGGGGDLIAGTSLLESDGGYFDANPGTPENGGSGLIAQFTVESLTRSSASAAWSTTRRTAAAPTRAHSSSRFPRPPASVCSCWADSVEPDDGAADAPRSG